MKITRVLPIEIPLHAKSQQTTPGAWIYVVWGLTLADHRRLSSPHALGQRRPPTRWRDMAIPRSRLASMRAAAWRTTRSSGESGTQRPAGTTAGQSAGECGDVNGPEVDRNPQPVQAEHGSSTIGPGREAASPVRERRDRSQFICVRPVRRLHLGQLDAAAAGRVDIEERQRPPGTSRRAAPPEEASPRGDEAIDQADERFAVGDVARALIRASCPLIRDAARARSDRLYGRTHAHALRRQSGRRADEHPDLVAGGERLAQHVAAEGSCRPG